MADREQPAGDKETATPETSGGSKVAVTITTSAEQRFDNFVRKGEQIIDTFAQSIRNFDAHSSEIKALRNRLDNITSVPAASPSNQGESTKRARSESGSESDDEVDNLMISPTKKLRHDEEPEDPFLDDLDSFFEEEKITGEAVQEQVAAVVNKSLRRPKTDPEKFKQLLENYLRPSNVEALQVPRVDKFLWAQLKSATKSQDVARQQLIDGLNKTAGPLIQAMDHCCGADKPDLDYIKVCISDAFKIVCAQVNKANVDRRDSIKKELDPKFKSLCEETSTTATGLFGENLQDLSKQLDQAKQIKMTTQQPFLGHGRGGKSGNQTWSPKGKAHAGPHSQQKGKNYSAYKSKSESSGKKWSKNNNSNKKGQ